jgi:hypothetical protein
MSKAHPNDLKLLNWQIWGFLLSVQIYSWRMESVSHLPYVPAEVNQDIKAFLEQSRLMVDQYQHVYPNPFQQPPQRAAHDFDQPFIVSGELFNTMMNFQAQLKAMNDGIRTEIVRGICPPTKSIVDVSGINPGLYMQWEIMKKLKHIVFFLRWDEIGSGHDLAALYCFFLYKDATEGLAMANRKKQTHDGLFNTEEPTSLQTLTLFFMSGRQIVPVIGHASIQDEAAATSHYLGSDKDRWTMDLTSQAARNDLVKALYPHAQPDRIGTLCQVFKKYAI